MVNPPSSHCFSMTFIMVTLWNRADHYIFDLCLLLSFFLLLSSPNLSGQRLDVCHGVEVWQKALVQIQDAGLKRAARGSLEIQDAKSRHFGTICATLSCYIFGTKACIDNRKKNLLKSNVLQTHVEDILMLLNKFFFRLSIRALIAKI